MLYQLSYWGDAMLRLDSWSDARKVEKTSSRPTPRCSVHIFMQSADVNGQLEDKQIETGHAEGEEFLCGLTMNRNRHRVQIVKECHVILIKQSICRKVDHVGHPLCALMSVRRDMTFSACRP